MNSEQLNSHLAQLADRYSTLAAHLAGLADLDPSTALQVAVSVTHSRERGLFTPEQATALIERIGVLIVANQTRVRVFHNLARHALRDGYTPGDPLVEVAAYDTDAPRGTDHHAVLSRAFELFNVGDDPAYGTPCPIAVTYRLRRNRSLSVGDVLAIADRFYACASLGWTAIPEPDLFVSLTTAPGSTPLTP